MVDYFITRKQQVDLAGLYRDDVYPAWNWSGFIAFGHAGGAAGVLQYGDFVAGGADFVHRLAAVPHLCLHLSLHGHDADRQPQHHDQQPAMHRQQPSMHHQQPYMYHPNDVDQLHDLNASVLGSDQQPAMHNHDQKPASAPNSMAKYTTYSGVRPKSKHAHTQTSSRRRGLRCVPGGRKMRMPASAPTSL